MTKKLTIDYSESLVDLIKKGKYDWVNSDVNDTNFPTTKKGKCGMMA